MAVQCVWLWLLVNDGCIDSAGVGVGRARAVHRLGSCQIVGLFENTVELVLIQLSQHLLAIANDL
jgi:hypothetical protein